MTEPKFRILFPYIANPDSITWNCFLAPLPQQVPPSSGETATRSAERVPCSDERRTGFEFLIQTIDTFLHMIPRLCPITWRRHSPFAFFSPLWSRWFHRLSYFKFQKGDFVPVIYFAYSVFPAYGESLFLVSSFSASFVVRNRTIVRYDGFCIGARYMEAVSVLSS